MALNNIELALCKLALYSPEFISLTAKLRFIPNAECPTAGTDGRQVIYSPDYVKGLNLRQCIGLVLHEVGHNMLAHTTRVGGRDKQLANIAMDIVLNKNLASYFEETKSTLNAEFPPTDLAPGPKWAKYDGWNWEKVYADLQEKQEKNGGKGSPKQFDYVEPAKNEDGSPMSQSQAEALGKEWAMAAQQAATMAKARGVGSGFFEEFVSGIIKTHVDWRAQVWDVFTKTAKEDQSWRRFNRKLIYTETYMPGMYSERMGLVAVFQDTSGSVSSEEFRLGLGCLNEVLETLKPDRVVFGCCDTQMQSTEDLTPDDLPIVAKPFKGRGGTVLTPIFEYVKGMDEEPELVVVLSDGEFEPNISKQLEPACPVVWLITSPSLGAAQSAFGRVIRVEV